MILDDGGDATMFVHQGLRAEQGDTVFLDQHNSEEEEIFFALIKRMLKEKPKGWFAELAKNIKAYRKRPQPVCTDSMTCRRPARCYSRPSTSMTASPSPSST